MTLNKVEFQIHDWIRLPDTELHPLSIRPDQIAGVYLRLLAKSPNANHDLFQVNVVIDGIEYEVETNARTAAFQLAKAIADLAIMDPVEALN